MSEFNQTVPVAAIKAAALFAAKEAGRYAFHGLLLEHGRLVATDGRRLAVVEWKPAEGDTEPPKGCILPTEELTRAAKVKRASIVVVNGAMVSRDHASRGEAGNLSTIPYQLVEGEFPDFRAVMPKGDEAKPKAEVVRFNPGFLADIGKAAAIIQAEKDGQDVACSLNGFKAPAVFVCQHKSLSLRVVLMPITS